MYRRCNPLYYLLTYLLVDEGQRQFRRTTEEQQSASCGVWGWVPAPLPPSSSDFYPHGLTSQGLTPTLALVLLYVSEMRYKNAT